VCNTPGMRRGWERRRPIDECPLTGSVPPIA
jgi:hypothetical protein